MILIFKHLMWFLLRGIDQFQGLY